MPTQRSEYQRSDRYELRYKLSVQTLFNASHWKMK